MDRKSALWMGVGVGIGLGVMYLLDPASGRRRRALVKDKGYSALKKTGRAIRGASVGIAKGTRGVVMTAISPLREKGPIDDDILVHRVRTKMGHVVSRPKALTVAANGGVITVAGPVLRNEVEGLLACVSRVRGVQRVESMLDPRDELEGAVTNDNGTQQGGWRRAVKPTTKVLAGATGGALAYYGIRYAAEKMIPERHGFIHSARNWIPFLKPTVAWWQRPFIR